MLRVSMSIPWLLEHTEHNISWAIIRRTRFTFHISICLSVSSVLAIVLL